MEASASVTIDHLALSGMVCPVGSYTINIVGAIADDAFYKCDSLTSVTIGNSVTSIRDHAFYNCRAAALMSFRIQRCQSSMLRLTIPVVLCVE